MPLDIQAFRNAAAINDTIKLDGGDQNAQLVQGGRHAWIKSTLNIGDTRAANARTIDALRQAVHTDPRYAHITDQADALLGHLTSSRPLNSRTVTNLLTQLDTASVQLNQEQTYSTTMKEINPERLTQKLQTAFQERDANLDALTPQTQSVLAKHIGAAILQTSGNFQLPLAEQAIKDIVSGTIDNLANIYKDIEDSGLPPNTQNILRSQAFDNGAPISRESMTTLIEIRCNTRDNNSLGVRMSDVSTPDSPLRTALNTTLRTAGVEISALSDKALQSLGEEVKNAINKAGQMSQVRVTQQMADQAVASVAHNFAQSWQVASAQANISDATYLTAALLKSPAPLPAAYLTELAAHAGDVSPNLITAMGKSSSPIDLLTSINTLRSTVGTNFVNLPNNLRLEGNLGHQNFLDHSVGLTLARMNLDQDQAQALYNSLTGSTAKTVRSFLLFQSSTQPEAASSLSVLTAVMGALADKLGIATDDFLAMSRDFPAVNSLRDLPVDIRSLSDQFQPVSGNVTIPLNQNMAAAKTTALHELQTMFHTTLQSEMQHHLAALAGSLDTPTFEKDLTRAGLNITLGGVKVPKNRAMLPLDVQQRLTAQEQLPEANSTALTEQAILTAGYNSFTAFVTGVPGAIFKDQPQEIQKQVFVLTSLCNQESEKCAQHQGITSLSSAYQNPSDPQAFALGLAQKAHRTFQLNRNADNDIVLRFESSMPTTVLTTGINFQVLDQQSSSVDIVTTMLISSTELGRLASQNWQQATNSTDYVVGTNSVPQDLRIITANLQLDCAMTLDSEK